jgi:hypothetical protein
MHCAFLRLLPAGGPSDRRRRPVGIAMPLLHAGKWHVQQDGERDQRGAASSQILKIDGEPSFIF